MSGPYQAFDRAILHLFLIVFVTLAAALVVWAVLAHMGLALPLPLVVVGVAMVAVSAVWDGWQASRAVPPPPTAPPPPHRPPTWEDAERMASLHRQGLITREQLDAVLRELVPPPPPEPPAGRRRR